MESAWQILGRLHPVAVHLPIGIFIVLALVELAALVPRMPRLAHAQRTFVLALGLGFAGMSALFGWVLAREGGYDPELLDRHQWSGFTVAGLAALLLVVHVRGWRRAYPIVLLVTVGVIGATGHFGGTLTHGENYLTSPFAAAKRGPPIDPARALVFQDVVHPILAQKCAACHGAAKSNGELRVDTLEHFLRGGKSGRAFKPGDVTASLMLKRAHLPLEAKEHMPPKGKPQLGDDELALLEWWIEVGAPTKERIADLKPAPAIVELINTRLGIPPPPIPDRADMLAAAETLERKLGVVIRPLTNDEPWLAANARLLLDKFGDQQLSELAPIAPALRWLDLGETAVTDRGLAALGEMKNLRRLLLDRTAVTDAGLARLSHLGQLESLNLHATKVTDSGLASLRGLPRLRSLYLWQTQVSPVAVAELAKQQTDKRKIARWRNEISSLEARIRAEQFTANLGESIAPITKEPPPPPPPSVKAMAKKRRAAAAAPALAPASGTALLNDICPVSGEAVDPGVSEKTGAGLVGFCCENCRDKFRAHPGNFPLKPKG